MTGVIEGKSLSQFVPGFVYEVDESTGAQLIALDAAIEVRSTDSAVVTDSIERLAGGVHVIPPDKADDRPERRRRRR